MCVNGAMIGKETTIVLLRRILKALAPVPSVCIVAVAGAAVRGTAECLIAAAALASAVAAAWVSVSVFEFFLQEIINPDALAGQGPSGDVAFPSQSACETAAQSVYR